MKALLKYKELIRCENILGWTVLHEGIILNRNDIVKKLLDHGADINAKTKNGQSVFDLVYNNEKIFKLLNSHLQEKNDVEELNYKRRKI
jgi:ankyrin repeat protein